MKRIETQVLIVGGGPTGLSAALLLQQQGIGCRVIERRNGPQRSPAAHVVNARTFEVWHQAGVDMGPILAAAKDPRDAGSVYWVTQLGGEVLGRLPFERQGDDVLELTPLPLRNLSQHRLEPLLAKQLSAAAAATLNYEQQWESAVQDDSGVVSRVRDRQSGEEYEVQSRYVIAADGAGSPVRRSLGIQPIGPDRIQSFLMIHFAADLRSVVRDCPGVLYFVSDPSCAGVFVAHDIDHEWVFMHTLDGEQDASAGFDAARCEDLVRRALVDSDVSLKILNISPWMMTSQVAERYGDGRIFLAGDAAHRFPPTGGLGLNTGVQDAHNLVWKLAAVEKGWAAPALLDTYFEERQPVAHYNAEQSFKNAARMFEVQQAIGMHPDAATASREFAALLSDAPRRAELSAAIANQAEHFDMLGLQLGTVYQGRAIVADGSSAPEVENPVREYVPSSAPGARLPHGWIMVDGQRQSTLDCVAANRFTLFAGPTATDWIAAAQGWADRVQIVQIGRDVIDADQWWESVAAMSSDGALLVRPDQHVAWRARAAHREAAAVLEAALNSVLQRAPQNSR